MVFFLLLMSIPQFTLKKLDPHPPTPPKETDNVYQIALMYQLGSERYNL